MASTSEIGHAKNVANFEDLISFCLGYGATYNPTLNAIKVANMNTLKTSATTSLTSAVTALTAFKNATNNREIVFEPVKKLTTKIMAAVKACGATEQTIKDVLTINYKIQGKRATPIKTVSSEISTSAIPNPNDPPVEVPTDPKTISVSQQSYDSMIEHMEKLINLLSSITAYNPNENELKVATLNTLLTSMKTSNTAVINAYTTWSNSRIMRNDLLYKKITGLVDIAQECKSYVKSIFGASSSQYKQVSKLKFRRVK
jgi:hypothetical protein